MSWIIRRLFNEKNLGYLYQKVKPIIQDDISEMAKEAVTDLLSDDEVAVMVTEYADAVIDREKKRIWSTVGGLQKGINFANAQGGGGGIDGIFGEDGEFNLASALKWYMNSRSGGSLLKGIGGQTSPQSGSGAQNAPD